MENVQVLLSSAIPLGTLRAPGFYSRCFFQWFTRDTEFHIVSKNIIYKLSLKFDSNLKQIANTPQVDRKDQVHDTFNKETRFWLCYGYVIFFTLNQKNSW